MYCWSFVSEIHLWPVNFPLKGPCYHRLEVFLYENPLWWKHISNSDAMSGHGYAHRIANPLSGIRRSALVTPRKGSVIRSFSVFIAVSLKNCWTKHRCGRSVPSVERGSGVWNLAEAPIIYLQISGDHTLTGALCSDNIIMEAACCWPTGLAT